jgi:hypothetical protein
MGSQLQAWVIRTHILIPSSCCHDWPAADRHRKQIVEFWRLYYLMTLWFITVPFLDYGIPVVRPLSPLLLVCSRRTSSSLSSLFTPTASCNCQLQRTPKIVFLSLPTSIKLESFKKSLCFLLSCSRARLWLLRTNCKIALRTNTASNTMFVSHLLGCCREMRIVSSRHPLFRVLQWYMALANESYASFFIAHRNTISISDNTACLQEDRQVQKSICVPGPTNRR